MIPSVQQAIENMIYGRIVNKIYCDIEYQIRHATEQLVVEKIDVVISALLRNLNDYVDNPYPYR